MPDTIDADALCAAYLADCHALMRRILVEERSAMNRAAERVADQIAADRLVHVYGPGGHSNLAAQEVFFRAGGLMHMSAILDDGTLISSGALRSMAIERTPGYGRDVIAGQNLGSGDLLILVNAYGINAALIDAAIEARRRGVFLIGFSSRDHASNTSPDHPARHPSKATLDGGFLITSTETRDQSRNKEDCLGKLTEMIQQSLFVPKPRKKTKPSFGSKLRRLDAKKRKSTRIAGRKVNED